MLEQWPRGISAGLAPIVGDGSRASTQMIETDSIEMSWGRVMARRVREPFFKCPNCDALYQVVRVEAGPETSDGEIACRVCGSPLAARDGEFVLKYFLLRAARRAPPRQRRQSGTLM